MRGIHLSIVMIVIIFIITFSFQKEKPKIENPITFQVFPHTTERHGEEYSDLLIIIAHKEVKDAQLAFDQAEKLKDKGVEIISVAAGNKKNNNNVKKQLQVISTAWTNTHSADYKSLWTVLDDVIVNICGLGRCTSCKYNRLWFCIMI